MAKRANKYNKPTTPRRETTHDPRLTCPTCKREGALTWTEYRRGYQCESCTALDEFGSPEY